MSAIPNTLTLLDGLWDGRGQRRPITFGKYGVKTTKGLWPMYEPALPLSAAAGLPARRLESQAGCATVSFDAAAVWEMLPPLHALAHGYDGTLKWCLAEKPYPIAVRSDVWTGNDALDPVAHDKYVSGGRWGFYWYDGSVAGRPKPIVHAVRFLSAYLASFPGWPDASFSLSLAPAAGGATSLSAAYEFRGPDCLFLGSASYSQARALSFSAIGADATNLMLEWTNPQRLRLVSTADASLQLWADAFVPTLSGNSTCIYSHAGAVTHAPDGGLAFQMLRGDVVCVRPCGSSHLPIEAECSS